MQVRSRVIPSTKSILSRVILSTKSALSVQVDLDIAQGNQTSSRLTLEEEWAQRARAQEDTWHLREIQLRHGHELSLQKVL